MNEFTKGPWKKVVHSWSDISIYSGEDLICTKSIREDCTEANEESMAATMEDNMNFIAAAPAMYEALERIASCSTCIGCKAEAKKALAAAEGRD